MKHKLPYDKRQTYQIGDICRIIHANNEMQYPYLDVKVIGNIFDNSELLEDK